MCGIWVILGSDYVPAKHQKEFMKIAGRGPDLTVISKIAPRLWLGFHRLAIVQPGDTPSAQPIIGDGLSVVCNGEIYNHLKLKNQSGLDNAVVKNGGSDCAAIVHAFRAANGNLRKCCALLDGVFAFAMVDREFLYVARDPVGIRPLFYGVTHRQGLLFGSEVKSIEKLCKKVHFFPPGCCAQIPLRKAIDQRLSIQQYHVFPSTVVDRVISIPDAQQVIRKLLLESVEKRLMGNRLFGFMLSGGLDSSLIATLATKLLVNSSDVDEYCQPLPMAFSVGFEDSPDLENARHIARYLRIPHRVLVITPEQCIAVIPDVVYALETFDPLVVRCGVAHFLLCKYISSTSEVKVLLSGEGADELFGSYTYMQQAPSHAHLHKEIHRRLKHLHQYDVLRCDRCTSCHGLEIRVPFLDKKFVDFVTRLPPSYKLIKGKMEKYILRSAFEGFLPDEVLWRNKEGFSEALGKIDLGDVVEEHADRIVSDENFLKRETIFPWDTPQTKEEFWYRSLFEKCFALKKMDTLIHTKVYKTAAWQVEQRPTLPALTITTSIDEKENNNNEQGKNASCSERYCRNDFLLVKGEQRVRRRSTGSARLSEMV